jgi:hypothetical protein
MTGEIELFLKERSDEFFPRKSSHSVCILANESVISENALIKLILKHGQKMNGRKNEFKVTSHFYNCFRDLADHFYSFSLYNIDIREGTILSYEELAKFVRCIKNKTQKEYFDRTDNLLKI